MLTEEEIRNHYKHKCNTGYDPLLCVHLTWYPRVWVDLGRGVSIDAGKWVAQKEDIKHYRHKYYHIDQIITEDRYVELITKTNTQSLEELTDIDKLDVQNVWLPMDEADEEQAAVFWLKPPTDCKTLTGLFNLYEAKIKIMFGAI